VTIILGGFNPLARKAADERRTGLQCQVVARTKARQSDRQALRFGTGPNGFVCLPPPASDSQKEEEDWSAPGLPRLAAAGITTRSIRRSRK